MPTEDPDWGVLFAVLLVVAICVASGIWAWQATP